MRPRAAMALAAVAAAAACTDSNVTSPPDSLITGPSFAISDAGHGTDGTDGFWFLPPMAKQVTTTGVLDENLEPSMSVCELDGNPSQEANPDGWDAVACTGTVVTEFPAGSATLNPGANYQFSWDTDAGSENLLPMDPDKFYRIGIYLEDVELGYLDVNPQNPAPDTPGEDFDDLYAFRLGETLPVKIFVTPQARCALVDPDGYVIQCTAQGVIDQNGGVVTLTSEQPEWPQISTVVPAGALPPGYDVVVLTMERIDPERYEQLTGEECVPGYSGFPGFDAPLFGDCMRVTTDPQLPVDLETAAFIDFCTDFYSSAAFNSVKFLDLQEDRLQMIRYNEEQGIVQGLPNVAATTCPASVGQASIRGFFPVPKENGLLRTAAVAANRFASMFAPEPLAAHSSIKLSSTTTGFSIFTWGLPGQMVKQTGDSVFIQQQENGSESYDVAVEVKVVDSGTPVGDSEAPDGWDPTAIEGATVHFSGDVSESPSDVTTGSNGIAATTWTVPSTGPGPYTMDATALGLLPDTVPDHEYLIDFEPASVTFTAFVVGLPDSASQSPPSEPPLEGMPGETLLTPLTITVLDENGLPVVGYPVTWETGCSASSCDGFISPDTDGDSSNDDGSNLVTDENGQATGYWTLATTPGENTLTVYVGSQVLNFVAGSWTAIGGCDVDVDGNRESVPGEWDCAVEAGDTLQFFANISGGDTPAEVRWQIDADSIYFLVLIQQSSLDKTNSLRIDFDNTGNGPSADDDAIGYDADGVYYDEYLTSKCVNRSQSGCGATDTVSQDVNGDGPYNDGTYTVYELSHPLNGTAGEDIRAADLLGGEHIGFYLTLSIGKGAQGNTQIPGFRIYKTIEIN